MILKKHTFILVVLIIVMVLPVAARGGKEKANAVATVNGEVITESQLDLLMNQMKQQYSSQNGELTADQEKQVRQQAVDELITDEVLYQEAEENGISVSKEELKQQLESMKKGYPDEETYKTAIESSGFTEKSFKTYIERNLIIQKLLQQEVESKIRLSEEEMKKFYDDNQAYFEMTEQVEARHILISTEGMETEEKKRQAYRKAQTVKVKLDNGAGFAELAKEESDCPSSSKGGNLGTFGRGQMVPAFEEEAFSLKVGEISDVVETQFGYHIIEVINKIESGTIPFSQAKTNIRQFLTQQKQQEMYNSYINDLRENADIEKMELAQPEEAKGSK